MPLGGIILSQVVGVVANKALSLIFSSPDTTHETLSKFLEKLSHSFLNQVEDVVRNAFIENRFDDIKSTILLGNETLIRYQQSKSTKPPSGDDSILNEAKHDIDKAYTQLKTQIDKILAAENNPPSEPHVRIKSFLKLIELSLLALQVLVPIDILISTEYIDLHENYKKTIVLRINEYLCYLDRLFGVYQKIQPLRVRQKEKRLYWPQGFEDNYQRLSSVLPNKSFMQSNSTYWVYSIEGEVEASVQTAPQPSGYIGYDVNYSCHYGGQNLSFLVRADKARDQPAEGLNYLALLLTRSSVDLLKLQLEATQKIWSEARDKIYYADAFNYLVNITENADFPAIPAQQDVLKSYYSQLVQSDKNTFLCRSIRLGKVNLARYYLGAGAGLDAIDEEATNMRENILFMAVRSGDKDTVKLILEYPINLETKNMHGKTASQIASALGDIEIVKLIGQRRFNALVASYNNTPDTQKPYQFGFTHLDLNYQLPNTGDTLLHLVMRHSDAIARHLVMSGASLFIKNARGETPNSIAEQLRNPNFCNLKFEGFLAAARASNVPLLRECLQHGVDINYADPTSKHTALHEAYRAKPSPQKQPTIDFLIAQKINVYALDAGGLLPQQNNRYDTVHDAGSVNIFIEEIIRGTLPQGYLNVSLKMLREYRNKAHGDTLLHEVIRSPLSDDDGCKLITYLCSEHSHNYKIDNYSYIRNLKGLTAKQLATNLIKIDFVKAIQEHQPTMLFRAINYSNMEAIKNYCEDGGNLNILLPGTRESVLNYAIGCLYYRDSLPQKLQVIRHLVAHGASVNLQIGVLDSPINRVRKLLRSWNTEITTFPTYAEALRIMKTKDMGSTIFDTLQDPCLIKLNTLSKWDILALVSLYLVWKCLPDELFLRKTAAASPEFTRNIGSQFIGYSYNILLVGLAILAAIFLLHRCVRQETVPTTPQLR